MKFCKKCHRRVIETITTNTEFTRGCMCINAIIPRGTELEGTVYSIGMSSLRGSRRQLHREINGQGDGPLVVTRET